MKNKVLGTLFLLIALVCLFFAYINGGPAWGEGFDFRRMMRDEAGLIFALGGLVCVFLSFLGYRGKKAPAV